MKNKILTLFLFLFLIYPSSSQALEKNLTIKPLTNTWQTKWQGIQSKGVESYGKMMIENLSFAHERSLSVYNDLVEKTENLNASSSKRIVLTLQLQKIKQTLDKNQVRIDELKGSLSPEQTDQTNWKETRQLVGTIIQDLRLSHRQIKEALKLLAH